MINYALLWTPAWPWNLALATVFMWCACMFFAPNVTCCKYEFMYAVEFFTDTWTSLWKTMCCMFVLHVCKLRESHFLISWSDHLGTRLQHITYTERWILVMFMDILCSLLHTSQLMRTLRWTTTYSSWVCLFTSGCHSQQHPYRLGR